MSGAVIYCFVGAIVGAVIVSVQTQGVDLTLVPEIAGDDVARAVIVRIIVSNVFPSDHLLLRRIAYVETRDGTRNDTYRTGYHGGIWNVNEDMFNSTRNEPMLTTFYSAVELNFAIDWSAVGWEDLRKPLYSGLAARLFLSTVSEEIPPSADFEGQAAYWRQHYNPSGTESDFVDDSRELTDNEFAECQESIKTDIIYVLDSSGSIGDDNYDLVKANVAERVANLSDIGPDGDQVGMIIFGNQPEIVFNLSTYSNQTDLLNAINNVPYLAEYTNTGDALRLMADVGFSEEAGAREGEGVLHAAFVFTDGKANRGEPVESASAYVEEVRPAILVHAVGVTDTANKTELEQIAHPNTTSTVTYIDEFDAILLRSVLLDFTFELCFTASIPEDVGAPITATLEQSQQVRYNFPIPEEGLTVRMCVLSGTILLYASTTIPNPNEVSYDWKMECSDCDACEIYVDPEDFEVISANEPQRRRRQAMMNVTEEIIYTNFNVYVSVEGVEDRNTFQLDSEVGDTTEPDDGDNEADSDDAIGVIIGSAIGGVLLLLVVVVTISAIVCVTKRRQTQVV